MALKFAEVIPKSTVIEMFDKFHKQMTGEGGYAYDESRSLDPWLVQRQKFILAGSNGIVDEKERRGAIDENKESIFPVSIGND